MRLFIRLLWVVCGALVVSQVQAQNIPGSCLASFNVKDTTFTTGAVTFSCRQLETRRVAIFTRINSLPSKDTIDGDAVAKELAAIEEKIRKNAAEKNWAAIGLDVSGHFIATLGLASCVETAGAGCALAVVGKVGAMLNTFMNAAFEVEKAKQAAALQAQIASVRKQIAGKRPAADKLRSRLVNEFTGLCADVKKHCL
jgi:hypothetical protein